MKKFFNIDLVYELVEEELIICLYDWETDFKIYSHNLNDKTLFTKTKLNNYILSVIENKDFQGYIKFKKNDFHYCFDYYILNGKKIQVSKDINELYEQKPIITKYSKNYFNKTNFQNYSEINIENFILQKYDLLKYNNKINYCNKNKKYIILP